MKKMLSLLLALVLLVSLIPAASARETRCYAEQKSPERIRIALGQTVTVHSRCYSSWCGGYGVKLYRITPEEAKDPLATGQKFLKNNKKYLDEEGEFCYHGGDVFVDPKFTVKANELGVGTYLHVAYTFDCTGKTNQYGHPIHEETYNYTEIAVNVIEIVEEEAPMTNLKIYRCKEDGTILEELDPTAPLTVEYGKPEYIKFTSDTKAPTEYFYYSDATYPLFRTLYPSLIGENLFKLSSDKCGEAEAHFYIRPYADGEPWEAATLKCLIPHAPQEEMEVLYWNTCTEPGLKAYKCIGYDLHCEEYFGEKEIPAPGHTLETISSIVKEPTATKPGIALGRCLYCQYNNVEDEIPAIFSDVKPNDFYSDPLDYAYIEGWVTGLTPTTFSPAASCNRAQAVTFLWAAAGKPEPTITEHSFVDVPKGSFCEKAVLWAVEKGITTGTDETHFSPLATCNRATIVTFLYKAFNSPEVSAAENPFEDVPDESWYTAPVLWAKEAGITSGTDATHFSPASICNRAQTVSFLYGTYN